MKDIKDYKTCELVEELKKREGVKFEFVEPYEDKEIGIISGPAIVLTVID